MYLGVNKCTHIKIENKLERAVSLAIARGRPGDAGAGIRAPDTIYHATEPVAIRPRFSLHTPHLLCVLCDALAPEYACEMATLIYHPDACPVECLRKP